MATCGYNVRQGNITVDTFVRIYDLRFNLRPLLTLPFAAGPSHLCFHPLFTSKLIVSSAAGVFSFADVAAGSPGNTMQVRVSFASLSLFQEVRQLKPFTAAAHTCSACPPTHLAAEHCRGFPSPTALWQAVASLWHFRHPILRPQPLATLFFVLLSPHRWTLQAMP